LDVLNEREKMVLELIMDRYINFAEPIGSGTIAKTIKDRFSSATIRNVMADLEEQGFLYKPHVVAGRVPTYKAYRYYVNRLSALKTPGKKELQALETMMKPHYSYVEEIMEDASKVLAAISKYTSIVVEPKVDMMLFKEVESRYPGIKDGSAVDLSTLHTRCFFNECFTSLKQGQLEKSVRHAYLRFYMKLPYILSSLKRIKNMDDLKRYFIAGLKIFDFSLRGE